MGTEISCLAIPHDFAIRDPAQRRFFQSSDIDVEPNTPASVDPVTNAEVVPGKDRITADLQRMFLLLFAEDLDANDPEILAAFHLFEDVWSAGKDRIETEATPIELPVHCQATRDYYTNTNFSESNPTHRRIDSDENHVIRSWQAVFAYLLTDFRFLYQ
jgi:hypothetical protein